MDKSVYFSIKHALDICTKVMLFCGTTSSIINFLTNLAKISLLVVKIKVSKLVQFVHTILLNLGLAEQNRSLANRLLSIDYLASIFTRGY
jgi:hypothetical protein